MLSSEPLEARIARLIEALSPQVIGRAMPEGRCFCGGTHARTPKQGKGKRPTAFMIERPSADCSVPDWVAWSVLMHKPGRPESEVDTRQKLSHWVAPELLELLFEAVFGPCERVQLRRARTKARRPVRAQAA